MWTQGLIRAGEVTSFPFLLAPGRVRPRSPTLASCPGVHAPSPAGSTPCGPQPAPSSGTQLASCGPLTPQQLLHLLRVTVHFFRAAGLFLACSVNDGLALSRPPPPPRVPLVYLWPLGCPVDSLPKARTEF